MSTTGAIVTYGVVWWLIFFMALPFGNRPPDEPMPGTVSSAPEKPRLLLKAGITTLLAGVVTWLLALVIESGLIELRPPTTLN